MKRIVVCLLLAATLLVPLSVGAAPLTPAPFTQAEFQYFADSVGCTAKVNVLDGNTHPYGPLNGYYDGYSVNVITDGTHDWNAVALIALHELGHCVQYTWLGMDSWEARSNWPWFEFEADAMAIAWAERFGVKPDADMDTLLSWYATVRDPHAGWDKPHGSPAGRILYTRWQLERMGYGSQGA